MISPPAGPPQLPDAGLNTNAFAPNNFAGGDSSRYAGAVSPASFNQFSNPGGPMAPTQVQPDTQARFRSADSLGTNQSANAQQNGQYSNGQYPNGQYPNGAYRQTAMQQPVMPPGNYASPNGYPAQQPNLPPSQFRNDNLAGATAGQAQGLPQGRPQVAVVAGDPRFVMQPSRPGNYPTVPYQAPFRTVAYQLPQQSPPVLPVQPPSVLPNQPQSVPATSALPQYASTVGVQPINYQALQPGYNCPPNIPSNGVPAYVPGAVVPPTLPPNLTPQLYTPDNAGYRPLFSLGQENYNVQLGRGIIGQPTVYVAGQPIRNFMRYIFP